MVRSRWGRKRVHEGKHLSADREWKRHDEKHEECHLCYEEHKNLQIRWLAEGQRGVVVRRLRACKSCSISQMQMA
jgi:hypothetical protein